MKNKAWFIVSMVELGVIVLCALLFIGYYFIPSGGKPADLSAELNISNSYDEGYSHGNGFIPDEITAKRVCSPIIDAMVGNKFIGEYEIEYDKENRMWSVSKYSLIEQGGVVIISQDTGEIISAYLWK